MITGDEKWHGTRGGYSNHGCRCPRCRKAHAEYMRAYLPGWRELRKMKAEKP